MKERSGEYWEPKKVPEAELFIPAGEPKFPLRGIAEHAIANFADPDPEAL